METSIAMGEFTEAAFLAVCERQNTTPAQVFERAAPTKEEKNNECLRFR